MACMSLVIAELHEGGVFVEAATRKEELVGG